MDVHENTFDGEEEFLATDISLKQLFLEKGRRMHGSPILFQQIAELMKNKKR